jgi:hypothetical protein
MKKLIGAFFNIISQNGLRLMSYAYVLIFSVSFALNLGCFISTEQPLKHIHLLDFEAETEEESNEDEKSFNDLFFLRSKGLNDPRNGSILRADFNYSLIAFFLEIILPPPEL